MKRIILLGIVLITLLFPGCQQNDDQESPVVDADSVYEGSGSRTLLTDEDLLEGFIYSSPVDEAALTLPKIGAPPEFEFEGRLELIGETKNGGRKIHFGGPLSDETIHIPEFDFLFVQQDGFLVPLQRGLILTDHPYWNYHIEPGRVWNEPGDEGYSRVSFPFALSWKGSNAILNGTMSFLFNDDSISKVWYQVTQETTISTSLDLWGLLDAAYHSEKVPGSDKIKRDFSEELTNRFPTKPIEALKEDYPDIDLSAFGNGVSRERMTWYGFVINGVQYLGGCQTRYGQYPYCEYLRAPSYSTAKSAFASLALMRLAEKYQQPVPELLIKDYVPEASQSIGNWEGVTFNHTLDMATGNYETSERMIDEEHWDTDPFWIEDYYKERIKAAFNWPNSSPPGEVWVYRTFDTFILSAAMQNYLKSIEGDQADIFQFVVDEIYKPLNLGPGVFSTVRTKDNNWQGLPVGGYGIWWVPDDLAKLTTFLNNDQGQINGKQILDPVQLMAALQQDPQDRGVVRDGAGRYNNAFWADQYTSARDSSCSFWVPHMYGYSGIVVALIPNGTAYYYASDNQQFTTSIAIQESDLIIPVCND